MIPPTKHYLLDADHKIIVTNDVLEWATWFENHANRVVKQDTINGIFISTVFIGMGPMFESKKDPLLFETMVFSGPLSDRQWRYASWDAALAGHDRLVTFTQANNMKGSVVLDRAKQRRRLEEFRDEWQKENEADEDRAKSKVLQLVKKTAD